jgi:hypothetical protein
MERMSNLAKRKPLVPRDQRLCVCRGQQSAPFERPGRGDRIRPGEGHLGVADAVTRRDGVQAC